MIDELPGYEKIVKLMGIYLYPNDKQEKRIFVGMRTHTNKCGENYVDISNGKEYCEKHSYTIDYGMNITHWAENIKPLKTNGEKQ